MQGFTTVAMRDLMAECPPVTFHPCAYYDEPLDSIRVQIRDCSFTEIRLNKIFTIYQANHTEGIEYVGFSIEGARALVIDRFHLLTVRPLFFATVLDTIVKAYPDCCADLIYKHFAGILCNEFEVVGLSGR
jgi:hypothetical protein